MDVDNTGYVTEEAVKAAISCSDLRAAFEFECIPMKDVQGIFRGLAAGGEHVVRVETFVAACLRMKGFAMSADVQALMMDVGHVFDRVQDITCKMNQHSVVLEQLLGCFRSQRAQTPVGTQLQLDRSPQSVEIAR